MGYDVKERWIELCEKAAVEQDPEKLLAFVKEINCLLESKDQHGRGVISEETRRKEGSCANPATRPSKSHLQGTP